MGCNVRVTATSKIDKITIVFLGFWADFVEISFDCSFLVPCPLKEIAETTGGADPGGFWIPANSSTYAGDIRAGALKGERVELVDVS